ncbi:MAG: alpha-2-macroglobulin [Rhizobiaceae bacterium]
MVRLIAISLVLLGAALLPAKAEITDAELLTIAVAYERSIEAPEGDFSVTETLRQISEARAQGRSVDVVRLSERLVAGDRENVQLWLNLARAWQAADRGANNGLAAAVRATQLADREADRLEALLVASAYLRVQLADHRVRYDDALQAVKSANAAIAEAEGLALEDDFAAPQDGEPDGRIAALERTRDEAVEASEVAAADIANAAAALDDVYREIQTNLPGANIAEMKGGDARLEFYGVESQYGYFAPNYRINGNDIEVCFGFNKELEENSRIYADKVDLKSDGEPVPASAFDVRATGRDLCLLRLEPGRSYEAKLSPELAAADGTMLGEALTTYPSLPNLPGRIGFADGEFMLPRSGPGDLPISLTNIESFPLTINRVVDRSLHRHLALGHIRNGIPSFEYQALITQFSEVLWEGTAERPLGERERNTTVRSFVPVRTILQDRADWLERGDQADWNRQGLLRSIAQPVRGISDPRLEISGSFVAGPLDVDSDIATTFVPGVYALATPVPDEGPNRDFHCAVSPLDPCQVYAAQWFVITDIGLTFYEGERNFTVVARSLTTGGPVENARIQLVSKGNRVLAEARTDTDGAAKFARSLTIGEASNALVAVMAETETDFNFLTFGPERLDLSRLNVEGATEISPSGAMIYTDRGIYQPGESVEVFALLRNRSADAARGIELRLEIDDYVVKAQPVEARDWFEGGSLISFDIPETAKPGRAALKLVSAANETMAETAVQLGKIRPDRARINFPTDQRDAFRVRAGNGDTVEITGTAHAQYLYGAEGTGQAPAANLTAEVTVRVSPVATPVDRCYGDIVFGRFDDKTLPAISRNDVMYTDDEGMLSLRLSRVRLPASTRPLAATIEVTLFDAAGPVASGQHTIQVPGREAALGLSAVPKPVLEESGGYRLAIDIASVDTDGEAALGRDVEILVERERESYAWENIDGVWQHTQLRSREEVSRSRASLDRLSEVGGPCPGVVTLADAATGIDDGRYVVTVSDARGDSIASTRFATGVAQTSVEDLEPNIFVLSSDKPQYAPGETVSLGIEAPFRTGEALVAIAAGDIVQWASAQVRDGTGTVTFTADPEWSGRGLYALATVFKADPGDVRSYGPARAIGAAYFEVSAGTEAFALSIRREGAGLENFIRPDEPLRFDVCIDGPNGACGAADMPDAFAIAYVVDEGLLSLTGHKAEAARLEEEFVGKAQLGLRVMDNYGRLLLKEGGDRPGRLALTNYTSTNIVAAASGPVPMRGGKASFDFGDLELQTGSLSIFVVAWTAEHVASTGETLPVRHFVVSSLGVPEFFLSGDRPLLPLRLENISFIDHKGDYRLAFEAEGGIEVGLARFDGQDIAPAADGAFLVKIPQGDPQDQFLRVDVPEGTEGHYQLALNLSAVDAQIPLPAAEQRREWRLAVRPSAVAAQEYLSFPLSERPTDLAQLLAGIVEDRYDPDTVTVVARFASNENALSLASLGSTADDPKAVLDQMIWQGFVDLQAGADDRGAQRLQANIDGIQALQIADGAFVPYRTDGEFIPSEVGFDGTIASGPVRHGLLRNASALDFLIRARRAGYSVSEDTITNSVSFIKKRVSDALFAPDMNPDIAKELLCTLETRYAMLVLVQQGELSADQVDRLSYCSDPVEGEEGIDPDDLPGDGLVEVSAGQSALSELITLAVKSEYGEPVNAETTLAAYYEDPRQYLGDLDEYRKAIAVSMLTHTGIRADVLRELAGSFLDRTRPLDLRTRAWLARSVANLDIPQEARLTEADISASDARLVSLTARPDGVVESGEIEYAALQGTSLSIGQAGGPEARAFVRVGGKLANGEDLALPESAIRRRMFHAGSGREFDPTRERLEVGDLLVVMLEISNDALARFQDDNLSDLGFTYGPLAIEALLPSAFTLVSPDLSAVTPNGDLEGFKVVGNVRAVDEDPQSWRAIVVPKSSGAVETLNGEDEEAADDGLEFRQAFVVSVSSAGTFLFPATTVDPLDFPGNTLLSQAARLEVDIPAGPRR